MPTSELSFKARYEALALESQALALESQRRQSMDRCLLDVLERERSLVTKLLYTMVPPKIARDLSNGMPVEPELFKYCVIFFSDIEGFTAFGDSHTPFEVFDMLNNLFSVMDYVTTCFPTLYKVETVGDAFMVVAGINESTPVSNGSFRASSCDRTTPVMSADEHIARIMFEFSILVNEAVQRVDMEEGRKVKVRIGLYGGPVVTGLTGSLTPRFCMFGDTVNCASRMESTGATQKIHIPESLAVLASSYSDQYRIVPRESPTFVKGKGLLNTFFLEPAASRDISVEYADELKAVELMCASAAVARARAGASAGAGAGASAGGNVGVSDISQNLLWSSESFDVFSASSSASTERSLLPRNFSPLEIRYRDAQLAKALGEEEREYSETLAVENEANALHLGEKNAALALQLKLKSKMISDSLAAAVRLESERLSLTDPKEARRYQAKADAEAMRVLQAIHEVAAELFQKNTKKADAMLTMRLSLARSLARDNLYTAAALIVDQAKIALDLLRSDGPIKRSLSSESLASLLHSETSEGGDSVSECSFNSAGSVAKNNGNLTHPEQLEANAAVTAMVISTAKRQDAHEAMDDEAMREEQGMLDAAQLATTVGATRTSSASNIASTSRKVTDPIKKIRSSSELESLSVGCILSGDAGDSSSRLGAFPQESPSFHAARRSEEMKAGIIPRTFDEFMQRDFNVLRVGNSQPLAITRAMLIIIEGVVGDLSAIDVSQSTFVRFLWKAGSNYHDCPYHNWHHAFCVVQYMAVLLRATRAERNLTPKELFIALLSAAIHDVDHHGLNNTFHKNSHSALDAKYNSSSTLERHHIDVCFRIMESANHNPLVHWSPEEQAKARLEITRTVLMTDMSRHNDLVKALEERAARRLRTPLHTESRGSSSSDAFDFSDADEKKSYLEAILHAADISNSVRPFAQSEVLATLLAVEFNAQTAKEKAMGLPIAAFMVQPTIAEVCKGEACFLKFVAKPYWTALFRCFDDLVEPELFALENNILSWDQLAERVGNDPAMSSEQLIERASRNLLAIDWDC